MNEKYQLLHDEMLKDIARIQDKELSEDERVTSCFWIAHSYWDRLKNLTDPLSFGNDGEEIDFFRNVKPLFTCQIEFFTIVSEALVGVQMFEIKKSCFWQAESNRFKRFCDRNEEFVNYYESGKKYKDSLFFLRRNCNRRQVPRAPVYDMKPEYCSSHDNMVRSYLANKMYWEYCKRKAEDLSKNKDRV